MPRRPDVLESLLWKYSRRLSIPTWFQTADQIVLPTDDAAAEAALKKFWSPHAEETLVATSENLNRAAYIKFIETLRAGYTDRKLNGDCRSTHVITALQNGKPVTVTCVAVMRIEWVNERGHLHGGRREIVTDATILNFSS
ncbi:hypothetical protein B0H13DRAFT_2341349 [Mycena leptocephala]|nr:hypothetical protein B0H13DRAFT_2341349 [Mycena leptocephala]